MTMFKACSIRDTKAEAWTSPMFFQSNAQAVRSFGDAVKDRSSDFGKHPEDYHLFWVGEFDDQTGKLEAMVPEHLAHGANLVDSGEDRL